jgi:hypothetical protein
MLKCMFIKSAFPCLLSLKKALDLSNKNTVVFHIFLTSLGNIYKKCCHCMYCLEMCSKLMEFLAV